MGFLSKVKNIFFEEEIIEVEDEPKKAKKEEPVAKKIELPKAEKVEKIEHEEPEYDFDEEIEDEVVVEEKENRFPMDFDEEDFKEERRTRIDDYYQEPVTSRRSDRRNVVEEKNIEEVFDSVEEEPIVSAEPKYDFEMEYGKEKEPESHGLYEGKSPKKAFTPTPIISPIYGILDKNYKKDDVVTKKEIRLSSAPKKIDLDSVREKAYGDLTSDIYQSMEDVEAPDYEEEETVDLVEDENLLYDLNDEASTPPVSKVTVGDAEEYFNELGLEYNVDYKDNTVEQSKKEKTRRSTVEDENDIDDGIVELIDESEEVEEETNESEGLESNLFDLIESMYDEKE